MAEALQLGDILGICALVVSWSNLRIADRAARNDVVVQLREWGDQVVDLLSEASELCRIEGARLGAGEFSGWRSRLSSRASSLWDRGRFFFPNERQDAFGKDKPSAFQGIRPPILDMLMLCFELTRKIVESPEGISPPGAPR
jgi:hypothetical protein